MALGPIFPDKFSSDSALQHNRIIENGNEYFFKVKSKKHVKKHKMYKNYCSTLCVALVLVSLFALAFSLNRVHANFLVVLLQGSQILTRL